jgi:hypothetical protein
MLEAPAVSVDCRAGLVTLVGEFDLANVHHIAQAVAMLTGDLPGVSFIDGYAVGVLDAAAGRLAEQGRYLELIGCPRLVEEVRAICAPVLHALSVV